MESTPWDPEGAAALLDAEGKLAGGATLGGLDAKAYYKQLVAARSLDLRLSRAGVPMWASAAGEEAPLVATARVADDEEWIFGGGRDVAIALTRGMPLPELVQRVMGREGNAQPGRVSSSARRLAAGTDALGMHLSLAAGHAHAEKLAGAGRATFALCGEGTSTSGAFTETLALMAACDLPLVLVVRSQLWPNGAPAEAGVLGDSVADRVRACGLWTRRVDGAEPVAVHNTIASAAERARSGRGPGVVDVVVTQLVHDPPAHRDPVERLRRFLDGRGEWSSTFQDVCEAELRTQLDHAFEVLDEHDALASQRPGGRP
ncbi:thiamine pyrophosphate-dependent enzyme [Paraliomyxa miuraensis]|uniref:thiamine pyrophosphate-dependent enzyme n=1 Tax=Paraliomyxa miuraensis TaxID=376150 RepID=UPI002257AEE5|nr:thiamine pyrophosphate-dependent enzyme [Paraliomyxa miuraensis]MCX4246471.1 thiamine pyrophosphate-dependent enzyme [Paraliomyxa miuraensis]